MEQSLSLESTDTHVTGKQWVRVNVALEGCPFFIPCSPY